MKLEYKGFRGSYEIDTDADLFHGNVLGLSGDVVTFQGRSASELAKAFRDSVDDYLEYCQQLGRKPKKLPSGTLSLRVPPELHQQLIEEAQLHHASINAFIIDVLQQNLQHSQ
jgi:predicted HicB family RNase H-like nuclease